MPAGVLICFCHRLSYQLHFDCLYSFKQGDFNGQVFQNFLEEDDHYNEGLILRAAAKTITCILYDHCYT